MKRACRRVFASRFGWSQSVRHRGTVYELNNTYPLGVFETLLIPRHDSYGAILWLDGAGTLTVEQRHSLRT